MRVGVTLAVIGAIVGEWAGADRGLGVLILLAQGSLFDIPLLFATLLTIAAIGVALYMLSCSWPSAGSSGGGGEIAGSRSWSGSFRRAASAGCTPSGANHRRRSSRPA